MSRDTTWKDLTWSDFAGRLGSDMTTKAPARDHVDEMLDVWAREIPDLDKLTEGIIERIQILSWNFNQAMDETLASVDLDRREFALLGKLRRHGPPYRASAGKLAADLRLSSGAITNRLDRMEAAGLIRRLPDPNDRRGTLVEPTEKGNEAWDATVGAAARREAARAGRWRSRPIYPCRSLPARR